MPQLPIVNARAKRTTDAGAVQATSAQFGGGTGKAMEVAGEAINKVSNDFLKAFDTMQYNVAKSNINKRINELSIEAANDTDPNNFKYYQEELNKLKAKSTEGMENKELSGLSKVQFDSEIDIAGLKIGNNFKKLQIGEARRALYDGITSATKSYVTEESKAEREKSKASIEAQLLYNRETLVISEAEYRKGIDDLKKWDKERAIYDAETMIQKGENVDAVFERMQSGEYELEQGDTDEILSKIETMSKRKSKVDDLMRTFRHAEGQEKIHKVIDAVDVSYQEKSNSLELMYANDKISKKTYDTEKRLMNSIAGIGAGTNDDTYAELAIQAEDLISQRKKKKDKEFLTDYADFKNTMRIARAKGLLKPEDEKKLIGRVDKDLAQATSGIAKKLSPRTYGYNNAYNTFKELGASAGTAFREYFEYTLENENATSKEKRAEVENIKDKYKKDKLMNFINKPTESAQKNANIKVIKGVTYEKMEDGVWHKK